MTSIVKINNFVSNFIFKIIIRIITVIIIINFFYEYGDC